MTAKNRAAPELTDEMLARAVVKRAGESTRRGADLQDLRRAMNRIQGELARTLDVGQDTVSRYEQRSDMLLSTLKDDVEAMGGELDPVAR